jgi:hypothetical protein
VGVSREEWWIASAAVCDGNLINCLSGLLEEASDMGKLIVRLGLISPGKEAYIAGVTQLDANGGDVSKIASVASFFISRIDTLVDSILEQKLKTAKDEREKAELQSVMGKVATANGKQTYQRRLLRASRGGSGTLRLGHPAHQSY